MPWTSTIAARSPRSANHRRNLDLGVVPRDSHWSNTSGVAGPWAPRYAVRLWTAAVSGSGSPGPTGRPGVRADEGDPVALRPALADQPLPDQWLEDGAPARADLIAERLIAGVLHDRADQLVPGQVGAVGQRSRDRLAEHGRLIDGDEVPLPGRVLPGTRRGEQGQLGTGVLDGGSRCGVPRTHTCWPGTACRTQHPPSPGLVLEIRVRVLRVLRVLGQAEASDNPRAGAGGAGSSRPYRPTNRRRMVGGWVTLLARALVLSSSA